MNTKLPFRRLFLLLCCLWAGTLAAQPGPDCNWMTGLIYSTDHAETGTAMMNFCGDTLSITPTPGQPFSFLSTIAVISDDEGRLLFYTNGFQIRNAAHELMLNGDSLQVEDVLELRNIGSDMIQGAVIVPFPEQPGKYVLIHAESLLGEGYLVATPLKYTIVDMSLDGGLGGVVEKNVVIRSDTLDYGNFVATRHANGRDWWVVASKFEDGRLIRLLITPNGVEDHGLTDEAFITAKEYTSNAAFSPDGSYYASSGLGIMAGPYGATDLLRFDRCTGAFSLVEHYINGEMTDVISHIVFSPDSKYMYQSYWEVVNQFDLSVTPLELARIEVAQYDGFQYTQPGFDPVETRFMQPQTGPDGKIYISTAGPSPYFHVIESPNSPGLACNVMQHALRLPFVNAGVPNMPNYRLGALAGSPCDTLIMNSVQQPAKDLAPLHVFPNPAQTHFTIASSKPATLLRLYDGMGRQVLVQALAAGQPEHRIALPMGLPAGVYVAVTEGREGILGRARVVVAR